MDIATSIPANDLGTAETLLLLAVRDMVLMPGLVLPMTAAPFVAAAARNLHLGAKLTVGGSSLYDGGAAAIDLAPDHILAPSMDMDGKSRGPSGSAVSIGAYAPAP